jgi:hypothetical protein
MRQFKKLPGPARQAFVVAVGLLVAALADGGFDPTRVPPALRLHKLSGHDVWSISFGNGMRAVLRIGRPVREGHTHIVWEFIGTHADYERELLNQPLRAVAAVPTTAMSRTYCRISSRPDGRSLRTPSGMSGLSGRCGG